MTSRVALQSELLPKPPKPRAESKLERLRETSPPPQSRVPRKPQASHAHEQTTFGHYSAAGIGSILGAGVASHTHRNTHRWCEYSGGGLVAGGGTFSLVAGPATLTRRRFAAYETLGVLHERHAVHPALTQRVREVLDRAQKVADLMDVALDSPWLAASEDGSIGLDWRHDGRRSAITFDASGRVEFYASDSLHEYLGDLTTIADVMKVVLWLIGGSETPTR